MDENKDPLENIVPFELVVNCTQRKLAMMLPNDLTDREVMDIAGWLLAPDGYPVIRKPVSPIVIARRPLA